MQITPVVWTGKTVDTTQVELFIDGIEGNRLKIPMNKIVFFKIDFIPILEFIPLLEVSKSPNLFRIDEYVKNDTNGLSCRSIEDPETDVLYPATLPADLTNTTNFGWDDGSNNPELDVNNWGDVCNYLFLGNPEISLDIEDSVIKIKASSIAVDSTMPPDDTLFPITWKVVGYLTMVDI